MSTAKESTLQLKRFKGVDRFVQGTGKEPDFFYLLQNMNQPNPGELRSLRGVTRLNGADIPGVESFKHIKFLDLGQEQKSLVAFYKPSVTSIPVPTGMLYSTSGGGAVNRNVFLKFVGPGNSYSQSASTVQSIQANGLTVTLPTNVPDYIFCVHVYIESGTGGICVWAGSFSRRSNVFPASITCPLPGLAYTLEQPPTWQPGSFSVTFGTSGSLPAKRQYYFSISAWLIHTPIVADVVNEVAYKTASGDVFSCYVPEGKSSVTIVFDYCPTAVVADLTPPYTTNVAITHAVCFVGPTIEDGLSCGSNKSDGTIIPTALSTEVSVNVASISAGNDTMTMPGNVPNLSRLKYVAATPDGGLTNNAFYYVRNPVYLASTNATTFQLSDGTADTVKNLDGLGVGNTFRYKTVTVVVTEIPESSDQWSLADSVNTNNEVQGFSVPTRAVGVFRLSGFDSGATQVDPTGLGCMALTQLPFTSANRREILTFPFQRSFTAESHTPQESTLVPFVPSSTELIQSRQYVGRLWCVNGFNNPFYTNGYVLKPAVVNGPLGSSELPNFFPITDFLEFFKDQLILAGMSGNSTYTEGFLYPSASGDPNDFGIVGGTSLNKPVRGSDPSEILGLNIYSQDLSNVGPQTFLVTGKRNSIFTWDGAVDTAPQQIDKSVGFAGPNSYALTRFGPVYVGRDNIYLLRTSQDIVPIGDAFKDLIQELTNDKLFSIQAVYHEEEVKIGLPTSSSSTLDTEIWLRMWYDNGGIQKTWTGPHVMKEYTLSAIVDEFNEERNYRASMADANLYRRDDPGSFLNDEQLIKRNVTILNLGMQTDHLMKLITQLYMGLRVVQDETFDITLQSQDGSQSAVFSSSIEAFGNLRQMLQCRFDTRFLARVLQLSVENESDADLSIYDFSILFQPLRRRRIP